MKNMQFRNCFLLILLAFIIAFPGCNEGSGDGEDPCAGVLCSGNGICVATGDSTICRCNQGYHAQGTDCIADLCIDTNCIHGYCEDPETTERCVCEDGYEGAACDLCAQGYRMVDLRCVPAGLCDDVDCGHGQCVVIDGVETCECSPGYEGESCDTCAEGYISNGDECKPESGDVCTPDPCIHGQCREKNGQAECTCDTGYTGLTCERCDNGYVADGLICVPYDENNPCLPNPCEEPNKTTCRAEDDSYVCACDPGYHDEDGACVADTVCDPETTCSGHGECTGEGLACSCDEGYAGEHCETCDDGYGEEDGQCVPDGTNPCAVYNCREPNTLCVVDGEAASCQCEEGHSMQSGVCVADCDVDADRCAFAKKSFDYLVSANGHSVAIADLLAGKLSEFWVHPYKTWGPTEGGDARTRNMLFDSYFGVRSRGNGTWLNNVPTSYSGYYGQDGIAYWVQFVGDLRIETFAFAPWELQRQAVVMLARVTNTGSEMATPSLYSLQNYHVGNTEGPTDPTPDASGEQIVYDGSTGAYVETGPGGAFVHFPLSGSSHHGTNSAENSNPYFRLNNGENLGDETDSGVGSDKVCGFQSDFTLASGESGWLGVVTAFEANNALSASAFADVRAVYSDKSPEAVLTEARTNWDTWRKPLPSDALTASEKWVYRVSEAVLRMGQVWEPNTEDSKPHGQVLAALPPGEWATTWIRDMSYAIVAFIRSGHFEEAKAALEFVLTADVGDYEEEVGSPYQISVCRYYGNGKEESDENFFGPNIEFDGFGLFLWALGEYVRASGDTSFLQTHWNPIKNEVADVLSGLIAENGMITADSSIWEVHWNGEEKQFAYTSLAGARGLCAASEMAELMEDNTADGWLTDAQTIESGLRNHALDTNFLVQSVEEFNADSGYVDAAVVEAVNWLVFDPAGAIASTTLNRFDSDLKAAHGYGYFRNDDGGAYDSREWVFIDLRIANALKRSGREEDGKKIVDWITAQALKNNGLIAELHDPTNGNYLLWSGPAGMGSVPMIGFGAGAYILSQWHWHHNQELPSCGFSWE